jgi:hypothetical protein
MLIITDRLGLRGLVQCRSTPAVAAVVFESVALLPALAFCSSSALIQGINLQKKVSTPAAETPTQQHKRIRHAVQLPLMMMRLLQGSC